MAIPILQKSIESWTYNPGKDIHLVKVLWRAIPRALAAAAPHRCRPVAHRAGMVDEWHVVHGKRVRPDKVR
jgi:hypothetical protein